MSFAGLPELDSKTEDVMMQYRQEHAKHYAVAPAPIIGSF